MKSYYKGILVGISIVLGTLLLMGHTSSDSEVGRYMLQDGSYLLWDKNYKPLIKEGLFKIDTKTGQVYEFGNYINDEGFHEYMWSTR